ncbi:MAG TPA: transglycosylase SLT domain-containing protein [Stellaceae bacterium]|nr:transglycosylase SLT domain-containing protein [Stellaceae bacterium]
MLVEPGNSAAGSTVAGAIRQASQATGTSFSYLLATAQVESGLNPQAGAPTSSARGLFQFVEQTWLGTIKQSGAALGYGRYAAAITQTGSGRYVVQDPAMRQEILKLRNDPTANAVMAGAFTKANATYLTQKLGRPPSEGELYIAHFLGAGGAARLIGLAASHPDAKAATLFPGAAQANRSIFFDRQTGSARSLAAVRNVLTARYDVAARSGSPHAAPLAQAANIGAPLSIAPDTAGIANAFAAAAPTPIPIPTPIPTPTPVQRSSSSDGPMFYGLFADAGGSGPVGPLVSQLWGAPNAAHAGGSQSPAASAGTLMDLFKDPSAKS